jgi:hypothetical protein
VLLAMDSAAVCCKAANISISSLSSIYFYQFIKLKKIITLNRPNLQILRKLKPALASTLPTRRPTDRPTPPDTFEPARPTPP